MLTVNRFEKVFIQLSFYSRYVYHIDPSHTREMEQTEE